MLTLLKTDPTRRIYFVWGLIMLVGFILSGLGIGAGYLHWFPLVALGLAVQGAAGLRCAQAWTLFIMWAGLAWLGTYYTLLVFKGVMPPDTKYFPHIGMAWLVCLGAAQIVTGFFTRSKIQALTGVAWMVTAFILRNTAMSITASFVLLALLTGVPYLALALWPKRASARA